MVKETTKARRKIKDLIKETTNKDYKDVKDTFKFSITTKNYNWSSDKTFDWKESENNILKWFYKNGYDKETAFDLIKGVKEVCEDHDIVKGSSVLVDHWNKDEKKLDKEV